MHAEYLHVSKQHLQQIRTHVHQDCTFQLLIKVILTGWPEERRQLKCAFRITVLLSKSSLFKMVILKTMCPKILLSKHASLLGVELHINLKSKKPYRNVKQIKFMPPTTCICHYKLHNYQTSHGEDIKIPVQHSRHTGPGKF